MSNEGKKVAETVEGLRRLASFIARGLLAPVGADATIENAIALLSDPASQVGIAETALASTAGPEREAPKGGEKPPEAACGMCGGTRWVEEIQDNGMRGSRVVEERCPDCSQPKAAHICGARGFREPDDVCVACEKERFIRDAEAGLHKFPPAEQPKAEPRQLTDDERRAVDKAFWQSVEVVEPKAATCGCLNPANECDVARADCRVRARIEQPKAAQVGLSYYDALAARLRDAERDVQRYRWLRGNFEHMYTAEGSLEATSGEWNSDADGKLLDAHCDSAIASAKGEKERA